MGNDGRAVPERIFISCDDDCAAVSDFARQLKSRLRESGFSLSRNEWDIPPQAPASDDSESGVDVSRVLLVVFSPGYSARQTAQAVLNRASGQPCTTIIPLLLEADGEHDVELPAAIRQLSMIDFSRDANAAWQQLFERLERQFPPDPGLGESERRHLERLIAESGQAGRIRAGSAAAPETTSQAAAAVPPLMRPGLILSRWHIQPEQMVQSECRQSFDDVLDALEESRRFFLLGAPGSGKTFTLGRVAAVLARRALREAGQPLPLSLSLKRWIDAEQTLAEYIDQRCGDAQLLDWRALAKAGRIALLLDGFNELPSKQRPAKMRQIRALIADSRPSILLVSCSEPDCAEELEMDLDRLQIQPLDPPRILDFTTRYLGDSSHWEAAGEAGNEVFFWHLAGGKRVREAWQEWCEQGGSFADFWAIDDSEKELPELHKKLHWPTEHFRHTARSRRHSPLKLAASPLLLGMLLEVFHRYGTKAAAPDEENELFGMFVSLRLDHQNQRHIKGERRDSPDPVETRAALADFAWALQDRAGGPDELQLALPEAELSDMLSADQRALARDAGLLEPGDPVCFSHPLLQQYFTEQGMQARIASGQLNAAELWPREQCWQGNGWEQATLRLAGRYKSDADKFFDWLARAHPHLLARCWQRQQLPWPDAQRLNTLKWHWSERLAPQVEPLPEARHGAAVALGHFGLDERAGIGLRADGLPEIDWVEIFPGEFICGEGDQRRTESLPRYHLSRYPITNAQYQSFIDDGGYSEARWWGDLAQRLEPTELCAWPEANRPRADVSWYEAMAFCRWLSARLGYTIRLPTEQEWEKGARGADGREYPWGDGYREGYANLDEGGYGSHRIAETTAVGLYPAGASPYGLQDMSGNVWEWCLNEHGSAEKVQPGGVAARVMRGGSWFNGPHQARAAGRLRSLPVLRSGLIGFRVCYSSPVAGD